MKRSIRSTILRNVSTSFSGFSDSGARYWRNALQTNADARRRVSSILDGSWLYICGLSSSSTTGNSTRENTAASAVSCPCSGRTCELRRTRCRYPIARCRMSRLPLTLCFAIVSNSGSQNAFQAVCPTRSTRGSRGSKSVKSLTLILRNRR